MDARARWRILRLRVEDQVPLARLARETDVGLRTLERWHARYRADGYAGLVTALTEIPQFCSSNLPTLGRSAA